jgi:hypothetical protein
MGQWVRGLQWAGEGRGKGRMETSEGVGLGRSGGGVLQFPPGQAVSLSIQIIVIKSCPHLATSPWVVLTLSSRFITPAPYSPQQTEVYCLALKFVTPAPYLHSKEKQTA